MPSVHLPLRQALELAFERLRFYSTSVFGVLPDDGVHYRGSGTFARVGPHRCLLTAGHVWEAIRTEFPKVALSAGGDRPAIALDVAWFRDIYFERGGGPFGPDLALLAIPDDHAHALEARGMAFYNLAKRRDHPLLKEIVSVHEPRVLIGTPGEFTKTWADAEGSNLVARAYIGNTFIASRVRSTSVLSDHDQVDLSLNPKMDDGFPHHYGGMSGSGLWWLGREESEGGRIEIDLSKLFLDGVAYYYIPGSRPEDEVIRAHGRRSVYVTMLDAVLPR